MLVNKEIDVSAIGLLMMPERRVAVDLCYPTFSEEKTLMMAVTKKNKLNVWVFMEIFPIPGGLFNRGFKTCSMFCNIISHLGLLILG